MSVVLEASRFVIGGRSWEEVALEVCVELSCHVWLARGEGNQDSWWTTRPISYNYCAFLSRRTRKAEHHCSERVCLQLSLFWSAGV